MQDGSAYNYIRYHVTHTHIYDNQSLIIQTPLNQQSDFNLPLAPITPNKRDLASLPAF